AGSWSCGGGTFTGPNQIAVDLGQSATCTIHNSDNPPSLTLVKVVDNDNGGTAGTTKCLHSSHDQTSNGGAGGAKSSATFSKGTYTLSPYTTLFRSAGSWSCGGGTFTGPNQIAVDLGQSATCTIHNNDNPPSLTLVKVVDNDNGGTALAANFTLSATGPTPISGAGGATSGPTFSKGTYTLSETSVAGYTAGSWSCVGGTFTGPNQIAV